MAFSPADPDPLLEADLGSVSSAFQWLDSRRAESVDSPLLRPIVGRDLHRRVFQEIIQKRAVPLLKRLLIAQGELRGERAERARDRTQALLTRLRTFDRAKLESPDAFFAEVGSLSRDLDGIIDDANYAVFGTIGLLHQLRSLNVAMRSSEMLWHAVRMGHAMREPDLQTDALRLGQEAQSIFDRAWRGDDITPELGRLEERFGAFKHELDEKMGRDSGIGLGLDGLRISRRVWSYRNKLERAILAREDREGHLDNPELCAWIRDHGVPPEVVQEILEEDVLPSLRAIAEDPARNAAAAELQRKARTLIERIESTDPDHLRTADQVEAFTIEIGRGIDDVLASAEAAARPADGVIRKLRESRSAADAIRVMLLGLRINETVNDTSFTRRASNLMGEVQSLGEGGDLERHLTRLESHLSDLGEETKYRLRVDHLPFLDKGLGLIRGTLKGIRVRNAAELALNPEVRRALEAFNDLEMPAERRRQIYDRALGKPLLETVVGLLLTMREVDLGFNFADVGRGLGRFLHAGGDGELNPIVAKSPLAFLARADFENAFGRLDEFLENVDTPERTNAIDGSLNVVRAVAAVEREALGEVAARIPEGQGIRVAASSVEWAMHSVQVLMEWAAKELAAPSGVATADFLDLMVDATETHLDSLMGKDPKRVDARDLMGFRRGLHTSATRGARQVGLQSAPNLVRALGANLDGTYAERLTEINQRLLDRLDQVETTETSRKAMQHIVTDLGQTMRMVVNLVHLFGAATNEEMDPEERAQAIQGSVERMGPLFVKLMQTLANIQSLLAKLSPDFEAKKDDPLFTSLKKLQDEVTPLPWDYIEEQIRGSLDLSPSAPLTEAEGRPAPFVSLEREPLKAGSIGQTHRAKIRVDRGGREEIVDVVVKVLRPDLDRTFEDTIRVTRLTMLVFKELLRLDANASIFGDVKPQAERVLKMLEQALEGFIETFRVETDFAQEAANLRAFRAMHAGDRDVLVPEVFDTHSKGNILTMEEVKGFKLSKWIERHRYAESAPRLAEDLGPLPSTGAGDEAVRRAKLFVEQTFDGTPVEARLERRRFGGLRPSGTRVTVRFTDYASRLLEHSIDVGSDGKIGLGDGPPLSRRGAERKAAIWGARTFGLPVASVTAEHVEERRFFRKREGYRVRLELESRYGESAVVFVDRKTGKIEPETDVPDLTAKGLGGLHDRLSTMFGVQMARGLLHGDPHDANFFVLLDGRGIGLFDLGLALDLGVFDAKGPLQFLSAAFLKKPSHMAEAMLAMSTQANLSPGLERDALIGHLTENYERILAEVEQHAEQLRRDQKLPFFGRIKRRLLGRFDQATEASKRALEFVISNAVLAPSPRHLQALKATFSMGGNLAAIEQEGVKVPAIKRAGRLFKNITLSLALAPFAGRRAKKQRNRELESIAQAAAPKPMLERLAYAKQSGAP